MSTESGVGILSTLLNQSYGLLDGTSQATAFVTGAAALLKECKASLDSSTIQQVLLNTVRPVSRLSGKTVKAGVVDYAAAINNVVSTGDNETIRSFSEKCSDRKCDAACRVSADPIIGRLVLVRVEYLLRNQFRCSPREVYGAALL